MVSRWLNGFLVISFFFCGQAALGGRCERILGLTDALEPEVVDAIDGLTIPQENERTLDAFLDAFVQDRQFEAKGSDGTITGRVEQVFLDDRNVPVLRLAVRLPGRGDADWAIQELEFVATSTPQVRVRQLDEEMTDVIESWKDHPTRFNALMDLAHLRHAHKRQIPYYSIQPSENTPGTLEYVEGRVENISVNMAGQVHVHFKAEGADRVEKIAFLDTFDHVGFAKDKPKEEPN